MVSAAAQVAPERSRDEDDKPRHAGCLLLPDPLDLTSEMFVGFGGAIFSGDCFLLAHMCSTLRGAGALKEVFRVKTTNAIWSADLFRSDSTFELMIVDQASGQLILREPINLANVSSALKH